MRPSNTSFGVWLCFQTEFDSIGFLCYAYCYATDMNIQCYNVYDHELIEDFSPDDVYLACVWILL